MVTFLVDMRLAPTFTILLLLGTPFAAQAEWPNDCEPWVSEYTRQNRACPGCAKMYPKDERIQCDGWSFEINGIYEQSLSQSNLFSSSVSLIVARTAKNFYIDGDGQEQASNFAEPFSAKVTDYKLMKYSGYDALYFRYQKGQGWVYTIFESVAADLGTFGVLATCTYTNSERAKSRHQILQSPFRQR